MDHALNLKVVRKAISSKFNLIFENIYFCCCSLFKCLIPIESTCDITLVFKDVVDVVLELRFDNGTLIRLDKSEKDLIVRNWKRKYEY